MRFLKNIFIYSAVFLWLFPLASYASELTYGDTEIPIISARSTWESDASLTKLLAWRPGENHAPPDYSLVERVIVHDQGCGDPVSCTRNATNAPIQTIQNIYRFHAVTKAWGDIGYNYIIDRQGKIYQGRYGKNGVRGAHLYFDAKCQNFNAGSAGILLLGDWRAEPPTDAQLTSLSRLTAWLGVTNGFDPGDTGKTNKVFQNGKAFGTCDATTGDFAATFTGPTLLSHGDIEEGNSDVFNFASLRPKARELAQRFSQYAFFDERDATPYVVQGGGLYFPKAPPDPAKIIKIASSQLDMFEFKNVRALADGTLIRGASTYNVYIMEQGQRHLISSPILFTLLGYERNVIEVIPERELSAYTPGTTKTFPEGTLVQSLGKPEVYVSRAGFLRHVSSAALFEKLGFAWQKIFKIDPEDLEEMPVAQEPLVFPDGTLIKGPAPMVYMVEKGLRRAITSPALLNALGLKNKSVVTTSDQELKLYQAGQNALWPDTALLREKTDTKVYLVHHGYKRWIQTGEAFSALGYQWKNVNVLSFEEINAYREGAPIAAKADLAWTPPKELPRTDADEKGGESPAPQSPQPTEQTNANTSAPNQPIMRVGITKVAQGATTKISVTTAATVKKNDAILETLDANIEYAIPYSPDDVLRVEPGQNGIITVISYEDRPAWNTSINDNRFRGVIEIRAAQDASRPVWIINELRLEEYLKGLAETINGDPSEYTKAFAIAARSYALYYIEKGGKRSGEPFHLRRTSDDQLYKGYTLELRAKDPVAGVVATQGIVATFSGKPILAAYSSGAPGPTKSGCALWGSLFCDPQFDYLDGGVVDPQDTVFQYQICGGATHCVGMDAAGARRMAKLGKNAQDILKTYYPGIAIEDKW